MSKTLSVAAVAFFAATLPAQEKSAADTPTPADYAQFSKKLSADQQILHALERLTFGPRLGDIEAVKKMGLSQWIDLQLHPDRIPLDGDLEKLASSFVEQTGRFIFTLNGALVDTLTQRAAEMQKAAAQAVQPQNQRVFVLEAPSQLQGLISLQDQNMLRIGSDAGALEFLARLPQPKAVRVLAQMPAVRDRLLPLLDPDMRKQVEASVPPRLQPGDALGLAKLNRAIQSDRQLEEILVDFWYNHFNVDASKGADRSLVTAYERDAIRPHVLGKFRDLLEATANSPAMMFYLDNWESTARGLNENYARELMELHTLGVDGGYTQHDIVEVARCFTGWSIDRPNQGGPFVYDDSAHDKTAKTVLGVTIPEAGGKEDGEKVLDILARHPSTAHFISRELAQRFVADDPPPALVDRMAKTFRDTDGDIRAVLSTLFNSDEFLSEGAYRAKLKTPLEMTVSAVRATGAKVDNALPLVKQIASMGQPLYRKLEPTGYSNLDSKWVNSAALMGRMNFAMDLTSNQLNGVAVDASRFSAVPTEAAHEILFADASPGTLKAIEDAIGNAIGVEPHAAAVAGMLLGSPDFQRK